MIVDAGQVDGDESMMYVVKENRAKRTKSCQIFRLVVKEGSQNYYQHVYEDNVGKPLLLV